ncbi:MAG: TolB family protein [bacterium]
MKESNQNSEIKFAYLSQGKLFFKDGDREVSQIESEFGNDIIKRSLEIHQRNEWKTKDQNTYFSGGILWNVKDFDPKAIRIHVSGVSRSPEKEKLFFVLQSNNIGGLFLYDLSKNNEKRLFHKENFRARDLNLHPTFKLITCSQYFQNGTANIIIMNEDGRDLQAITEGDSFDEAPSWIPGNKRQIVFQSAGVARNEQGYAIGIGPFTIQKIDLENGNLITL